MTPIKRTQVLERQLRPSAVSAPVTSRRVVLKANPQGEPLPSDYEIVTETLRPIANGEMLLKTKFLSLDPYHLLDILITSLQ
jgi:NADPH-dependent curcumin reductase CurA